MASHATLVSLSSDGCQTVSMGESSCLAGAEKGDLTGEGTARLEADLAGEEGAELVTVLCVVGGIVGAAWLVSGLAVDEAEGGER